MTRPVVHFHFEADRQWRAWEVAHEQGNVPGRWLYGLDRMEDIGLQVNPSSLRPGRLDRDVRGVVRALRSKTVSQQKSSTGEVYVTWDENGARRLRSSVNTRAALATGVIWLTDSLVRHPRSIRVQATRRVIESFDLCWTLSRHQAEVLKADLRSEPMVRSVVFGVDTDFFTPAVGERGEERPLVLSLGNDRDRDLSTLNKACRTVLDARPDTDVVVLTKSDFQFDPRIDVRAPVSHTALRDLYRRATAVVLPTVDNHHVSGMTAGLEALACGVPLVVSDTPGMSEYFTDQVHAIVTPVGDAGEVANGLIGLLDDERLWGKLSAAGRDHVVSRHDHAALASSLGSALRTTAGDGA